MTERRPVGASDRTLRAPTRRDVAIVGAGVVGMATGFGLASRGHRVVFVDVSSERIQLLRQRGHEAVPVDQLSNAGCDVFLVSVPTPTVRGEVDLAVVRHATAAVGQAMAASAGWPVFVLRSTVPPGTTEELVIPILERVTGGSTARDFGVCMNPEFLRAASAEQDFLAPRVIVVGGNDQRSRDALIGVYASWNDVPLIEMNLRTAEGTKYVANLFNAAKISFFNEMGRVLRAFGADPDVAFAAVVYGAEGLWNPTYGTRWGTPFGGMCLPKDASGFLGFLTAMGMEEMVPMLKATITVNEETAKEYSAA